MTEPDGGFTIRRVAVKLPSGSRLLTIGYQGRSLAELIGRLRRREVRLLVDVRKRARSRRPEFNRDRLEAALAAARIPYVHLPNLGSPRRIRRALSETGDFERFAGFYLGYVRRWRLGDVDMLARYVRRHGAVCILCYESDHGLCHRSILANETLRRCWSASFSIEHI